MDQVGKRSLAAECVFLSPTIHRINEPSNQHPIIHPTSSNKPTNHPTNIFWLYPSMLVAGPYIPTTVSATPSPRTRIPEPCFSVKCFSRGSWRWHRGARDAQVVMLPDGSSFFWRPAILFGAQTFVDPTSWLYIILLHG